MAAFILPVLMIRSKSVEKCRSGLVPGYSATELRVKMSDGASLVHSRVYVYT